MYCVQTFYLLHPLEAGSHYYDDISRKTNFHDGPLQVKHIEKLTMSKLLF